MHGACQTQVRALTDQGSESLGARPPGDVQLSLVTCIILFIRTSITNHSGMQNTTPCTLVMQVSAQVFDSSTRISPPRRNGTMRGMENLEWSWTPCLSHAGSLVPILVECTPWTFLSHKSLGCVVLPVSSRTSSNRRSKWGGVLVLGRYLRFRFGFVAWRGSRDVALDNG